MMPGRIREDHDQDHDLDVLLDARDLAEEVADQGHRENRGPRRRR
jgi:hypothetical protein